MAYTYDSQNVKVYNNRTGHYKFDVEYKFILAQLGDCKRRLLDIGGGSGRFALPLSKLINEVVVVEPALEALEILKSRIVLENIKLYHGTLSVLEEGDFDLVIIIEVLGDIEDVCEFFRTISEITVPNAKVIFSVANPHSWRFTLKKIMELFGRKYYRYNNFISLGKLESILYDCGFNITEKKGFNWIPLPLSSDSIFVTIFVYLEKLLGLSKWINQSPWVLIAAQKNKI